jgi:hypothetical protein
MQITRSSIATARGPTDWFTGDVSVDAVHWLQPPSPPGSRPGLTAGGPPAEPG